MTASMPTKTLTALRASITIWERRAAGKRDNRSCPLCDLFNNSPHNKHCAGCPVFETTGARYCRETPVMDWYRDVFGSPEETSNAKRELKFLQSLLPKESIKRHRR